jgi:K+-sensing histidine kinase KdpD
MICGSLWRCLEAARDDLSSGAGRDTIGEAIGDVEGVLDTFNALLRIGQIEAGARRAAFRPLDLAEVAREVAEAFAPAAEDEGKTLVTHLDVLLPLAGDKELLVQMIANLIDNALRYTPAGVRIEVAGARNPLSVSDNGPGVAPADMATIFQRFYRAGEAQRSSGTGLGLALVAAIADLHGLDCRASRQWPRAKRHGCDGSRRGVKPISASSRRDAMTAVESWAMIPFGRQDDIGRRDVAWTVWDRGRPGEVECPRDRRQNIVRARRRARRPA